MSKKFINGVGRTAVGLVPGFITGYFLFKAKKQGDRKRLLPILSATSGAIALLISEKRLSEVVAKRKVATNKLVESVLKYEESVKTYETESQKFLVKEIMNGCVLDPDF